MKFRIFKLKTRQKIVISNLILTAIYVIFQRVNFVEIFNIEQLGFDLINPLILAIIAYILMFWVAEFRIREERFVTILGFPASGVFVFSLFVELIINSIFGQLGLITFIIFSGALFFVFTYILFLTANILNVAYLEDIPLGQAGRAAYYILNMIIEYLLFLIITSNDINIGVQLVMLFLVSFFIVTSTLWTIKVRAARRLLLGMSISTLISFAYLILAMWPVDVIYISFILLLFMYILLGVALEIRETVSRMIWFEYGTIFLIIFILLLLISNWGINGSLT